MLKPGVVYGRKHLYLFSWKGVSYFFRNTEIPQELVFPIWDKYENKGHKKRLGETFEVAHSIFFDVCVVDNEKLSKLFIESYLHSPAYERLKFFSPKRFDASSYDDLDIISGILECIDGNSSSQISRLLWSDDGFSFLNVHARKTGLSSLFSKDELGGLQYSISLNMVEAYLAGNAGIVFKFSNNKLRYLGQRIDVDEGSFEAVCRRYEIDWAT